MGVRVGTVYHRNGDTTKETDVYVSIAIHFHCQQCGEQSYAGESREGNHMSGIIVLTD